MQQWFLSSQWWFWIAISLSFAIGAGGWGLLQLLHLPVLPDCLSNSWSQHSITSVFYCAKTIADEEDANKLSRAIEFANSIPQSHPQRQMAERLIEKWSQAILSLGENAFQQGDKEKAVDIVQQIPLNVPAHQDADNRIKQWNSIWSKATEIYETALAKMDKDDRDNSYVAFSKARELLKVGNDYWATTKYQELIYQIQDIREKNEEREASLKNEPQAEPTPQRELIDRWEQDQEAQDLAYLKKARILASSKKIEDLRDAITEASMVSYGRYYEEAQKLVARTRDLVEIADDRSSLEQAKELASHNDFVSLQMAINEASSIGKGRPLYREANENIAKWTERMSELQAKEKSNY